MINEEISKELTAQGEQVLRYACDYVGKLTKKAMMKLMTMPVRKSWKAVKEHRKDPHGKMSVKKLMRKDESAQSVDVSKLGLKDFKKETKKMGVDFAIYKIPNSEPQAYRIFFKARDMEAINTVYENYTKRSMKKEEKSKPSLLKALKAIKEMIVSRPHNKAKNRNRENVL